MPSLNFDTERVAFREYYHQNIDLLDQAQTSLRVLVRLLLSSGPNFDPPVVTSRLKDCDGCIKKFQLKYQGPLEQEKQEYSIKDHITDLIGIRVQCYYETDMPHVLQVLHNNFFVLGVTDKTAELEADVDTFGYKGVHLDVRLHDNRINLPEYASMRDVQAEIQVRTIVQHAWSELDHKIAYKHSVPKTLQRRIRTLAALFELADREFVAVREQTQALSNAAATFSDTATEQPPAPPSPLDAFQFQVVVQPHFPEHVFFPRAVDGFVQEILKLVPEFTLAALQQAMESNIGVVKQYAAVVAEQAKPPTPFTMVRHVLYASAPDTFEQILFDKQRSRFDDWRSKQPPKVSPQ